MAIGPNLFDQVQIRLTSSAESVLASLQPYAKWIEQILDAPLSETLTLEVDCNPADTVAEELLRGLFVVSATKARNSNWRTLIEDWELPPGVSPRIAASLQRERKPNAAPLPVWELDWQDCPVAFRLRGLARRVVSVKVSLVFPPGDMPIVGHSPTQHWFIAHREDAAKVLLLDQELQGRTERYLETAYSRTRLQARYDWDAVVLDATTLLVVATANDPTCLDPAILKRPGRFDRVVQFRNPDADLRRQYYSRLSPTLAGEQFESAIEETDGFSFAQLRETYILGSQSAFEHGREVGVADVIEAITLQAEGAQDLKTSVAASGFVARPDPSASRK